mmetsp:Transcript_35615/g.90076  ORF Transcript_35615/g.90076 Transcript_35615/m.90076 type:complete len:206 (-) Transcript_35615:432-1049(-)
MPSPQQSCFSPRPPHLFILLQHHIPSPPHASSRAPAGLTAGSWHPWASHPWHAYSSLCSQPADPHASRYVCAAHGCAHLVWVSQGVAAGRQRRQFPVSSALPSTPLSHHAPACATQWSTAGASSPSSSPAWHHARRARRSCMHACRQAAYALPVAAATSAARLDTFFSMPSPSWNLTKRRTLIFSPMAATASLTACSTVLEPSMR